MEILIYIAKSTALLSLFFLTYELLLKRETLFHFNRFFLLVGILVAGILPFLNFTKTVVVEQAVMPPSSFDPSLLFTSFPMQQAVEVSPSFWASLDYTHILIALYVLGSLFVFGRFLVSLIKLRKILSHRPKSYRKNGIRYIETDLELDPFTFLKTVVFNPSSHSEEELEMILHHEKTHAYNWHGLDILAGQLLLVIHWFNPLAWLYSKRIDQNLEFIADASTTKDRFHKKSYQMSLLRTAMPNHLSLPVNNFHSFTKIRILMLNKSKSHHINSLKALLVLPFLAVFLMSFQVETVTEFITANQIVSSKEIPLDDNVEKLRKILEEQKENAIILFNGKKTALKELDGSFYKLETLKFDTDGTPVIHAKQVDDSFWTAKPDDLPNGIYLKGDNSGIILLSIGDENKEVYVYKSRHSEVNKMKIKQSLKEVEQIKEVDKKGIGKVDNSKGEKSSKTVKIDENNVLEIYPEDLNDLYSDRLAILSDNAKLFIEYIENNKEAFLKIEDMQKDLQELLDSKLEFNFQFDDAEFPLNNRLHHNIPTPLVPPTSPTPPVMSFGFGKSVLNFQIDENVSDATLKEIAAEFAKKGVDFKYKNVKRNKAGKIINIKMTLDNNKGSQSQVSIKNSEGIGTHILGIDVNGDIYIRATSGKNILSTLYKFP